jgi:signal transduction histidine kinase/CheY-like chemotaxis protein
MGMPKKVSSRNKSEVSETRIRELEELLSQRDAELARLSSENQFLTKEKDQRATELQIINNIGQMLTEGLDLQSTLERVGERLREVLKVESIGIIANDIRTGLVISAFVYLKGKQVIPDRYSLSKNMLFMRFVERTGGKPVVINTNVEKNWRKFLADSPEWAEIPKAFVMVPLLAGGGLVGSITIPDYEREDAFTDLPINMLETIASNMGTAIQNVRLFDETQRLLKETEQRATELQIINNIGQTLTEGLDLQSTLERVGDRLRDVLKPERIGITVFDEKVEHIFAHYGYRNGRRDTGETLSLSQIRASMRLSARGGGRSWVVNRNAEKSWRIFGGVNEDEIPKSFAKLPLHAGGKVVGGITLGNYTKEDAFTDISIGMLETIASNIGTAIHNVRLFDETQRLLKETEQRATELQIINNIEQTLTEGLDLNTTLERVGDRLREALNIKSMGIVVYDPKPGLAISNYFYHYGRRFTPQRFSISNYKFSMRLASRVGNKPLVVNANAERYWKKFLKDILPEWKEIPKSFVIVPLLAGGELVGSITIGDYENENAFTNLPINLLETIASNMGTAIQNVRLFDETKRLFEEAEESRAAAEQANKAKSTFLANMSHELRTPLNAIMGFTQIVKGKAQDVLPEKQINNLEKVLTSSQHLLGLINTVLDIAKIEAGRMDVIPGKFSLSGFADQCLALATPLLKPNVTLEKQVDETIGFVFSDQDKIKQIILNLLSNAAKFTHEGKIILKVEKLEGEMIGVSVKDSGIGISEEAVGRVFEEFQQAETTTTRQYGGTGLGLTISRNLARLLGGDLTASSVLGEGSTFTLTFPMRYEKDNASSAARVDPVHSAESTLTETSNQAEAKKVAQTRKTILLVEDTELNVNFITQLLEDDYELIFAKNGAQGVTLAELEKPDLILMDISLPIMDGYEATRRIRINTADTPIIGLSAYAMVGDAEKAKEAGCNDYVTKPVDGNLLKNKISEYLR